VNDSVARLTAALADRYRIERELGAGGMATVYLAHDLKHDRDVAIKVLHPDLGAALGSDRFLTEIRTTARLQHPHILPLLDSGEAGGLLYYAMPLVTGETLRTRLERERQLPIDDAIRIAREAADALGYAHGLGVIHRDVKPENILLQGGHALVADFGIALAVQSAGGQRMTQTGLSLGTPQYMSPEQAMGERAVDARSDIYALGAVTYEMLAGDPPFTGSSVQAIVAKVMTERPSPISTVRNTVPPHVEAAVLTALAKLPADRFATATEFAQALADRTYATTVSLAHIAPSRDIRRWRLVSGMLAIALIIVTAGAALGWMRQTPPGVVRRFYITMSQYAPDFGNPVISPDGTRLVYSNTEGALMMRRGDDLTAKLIPGSDAAWATVFSPDSRSLAINTGFPGALKIIPLEGGPVRTLVTDSTYGSGIAWSGDDWIYFLHGEDYGRDLKRIRASGGAAEFVARPDSAANALFFYWPQVLPGGRKLLLTVYPIRGEPSVGVLDVTSGKVTLIAAGVKAHFAPTGHVLVVQGDGLLQAARFNPSSGTVLGGFTTVAEGLYTFSSASAALALSDDGTLLYQPTPAPGHVVRVSRTGGLEEILDPAWRGAFWSLALSPDGAKLAVGLARGGRSELWVKALGQGTFTRLSAGGTQNYRPSWSPDGREVVFTSDQNGKITTYRVPADGSALPGRLLPAVKQSVDEAAYSRDGQWIVFRGGSGGGRDIYAIRPGVDSSVRAIVAGPAEEFSPALSPDGRWLAYASDETGRTEVYVRPFPDARAAKYTVSHDGGAEPLWSHSGKELFFRDGAENLVAAEIASGDAFRVMSERALFSTHDYAIDNRHRSYTVSLDDRSFIFVKTPILSGIPNQMVITLNWFEELKRKMAE
jgi:eukaryotic-like serine/threonine-protein kinase